MTDYNIRVTNYFSFQCKKTEIMSLSLSASPVASWDLADAIQTVKHSPAVKTHTLSAHFSMLDSLPSVRTESVKNQVTS